MKCGRITIEIESIVCSLDKVYILTSVSVYSRQSRTSSVVGGKGKSGRSNFLGFQDHNFLVILT